MITSPSEPPLLPPADHVLGPVVEPIAYLARVVGVHDTGEVTITVWERPAIDPDEEGVATLSIDDHFAGTAPHEGDLLWIWTWLEGPSRKPRLHLKLERPELTEEDRARLRALVEKLSEQMRADAAMEPAR